jgi:hypothetical protein
MRHPHGASSDAWVFALAGDGITPNLVGGADITCWSDQTGGTQYADLLDGDGATPITSVTSSSGSSAYSIGQIPLFYGPDNISGMWISAAGGPRTYLRANDLDARANDLEDGADARDNRLDLLEKLSDVTPFFMNDDGSGFGARPDFAGDRLGMWFGGTNPGIGGDPEAMRDNLDVFVDRTP